MWEPGSTSKLHPEFEMKKIIQRSAVCQNVRCIPLSRGICAPKYLHSNTPCPATPNPPPCPLSPPALLHSVLPSLACSALVLVYYDSHEAVNRCSAVFLEGGRPSSSTSSSSLLLFSSSMACLLVLPPAAASAADGHLCLFCALAGFTAAGSDSSCKPCTPARTVPTLWLDDGCKV